MKFNPQKMNNTRRSKSPQLFRKEIFDMTAYSIEVERKRKEKYKENESKREIQREITVMNDEIDKLIKSGKSSGAIKQTIKKLFPEIVAQMESEKIDLGNGKETDRLSMQIEYRVEEFRRSIPMHYEGEEK